MLSPRLLHGYHYGYSAATAERIAAEEAIREQASSTIEDVKEAAVKAIEGAVKAVKAPVYVVSVEPVKPIEVDWLTPYEEVLAKLSKTTTLILSDDSKVVARLNWTSIADPLFPEFKYSPYMAGVYRATAVVEVPYGVEIPGLAKPLTVTTNVTVMSPFLPHIYTKATPLTSPRYKHLFNLSGTYKSEWMIVEGLNKTYHYYVPSSYDGTKPVPLVISLHGAWSCGLAQLLGSDEYAEKYGFTLVCPDSYGYIWSMPIVEGTLLRRPSSSLGSLTL